MESVHVEKNYTEKINLSFITWDVAFERLSTHCLLVPPQCPTHSIPIRQQSDGGYGLRLSYDVLLTLESWTWFVQNYTCTTKDKTRMGEEFTLSYDRTSKWIVSSAILFTAVRYFGDEIFDWFFSFRFV